MASRSRLLAVLVAAAACATAVTGCGSDPETATGSAAPSSTTTAAPATSAPATTAPTTTTSVVEVPGQVLIRDYELLPPTITVAAGTTVTWVNADDVDHAMLSDDGTTVDSGPIAGGQSYQATLAAPGTYPYYCDIHNSMTGTIVVE